MIGERKQKVKLYTLDDCRDRMFDGFHRGKVKGTTTYISDVDKCWTWRKQEFNLWTGYNNEGKSLWLRYLALIKALMDGWTYLFAAPEDFPPEEFYDDLIHTLVGMSTDKDNPHQVPEDWYIRAADLIKSQIFFVYTEPGTTIADALHGFNGIITDFRELGKDVDVCVIDPLIKFARPRDLSDRDDIYAQHVTTLCTDFCRTRNISLHMVLHQLTPRALDGSGYYPKPSAYNIKGGGTWADGVDNILTVSRPEYAKDKASTLVKFSSQKIKKQKLVGIPQEFDMKFDRKSNRYVTLNGSVDLFDFDSLFQRHLR